MTIEERQAADLEGMQYAEMRHTGPMLPTQIADQYAAIQRRPIGDHTPVIVEKKNQVPAFVVKGVAGLVVVVMLGKAVVVTVTAAFIWMEAHIFASAAIIGVVAFVVFISSGGIGSSNSRIHSERERTGNTYNQYNYYYNHNGPSGRDV